MSITDVGNASVGENVGVTAALSALEDGKAGTGVAVCVAGETSQAESNRGKSRPITNMNKLHRDQGIMAMVLLPSRQFH